MKFSSSSLFLLAVSSASGFQLPRTSTKTNLSSSIPSEDPTGKPASPMTPPKSSSSAAAAASDTSSSSSATTTPAFENLPTSFQDIKLPSALQDFQNPLADMDIKDLSKNLLASFQDTDREFGSRGELFVAAQFVLIVAIALGGGLPLLDPLLRLTGPALVLGGLAGAAVCVNELGASLSPFTTPRLRSSGAFLQTSGPYAYVRHPLYTALLSVCAGGSMVTDSASRLVLTALLGALLYAKTSAEEEHLVETYGEEYTAYQEKVSGRFLPMEWLEDTKKKLL